MPSLTAPTNSIGDYSPAFKEGKSGTVSGSPVLKCLSVTISVCFGLEGTSVAVMCVPSVLEAITRSRDRCLPVHREVQLQRIS